MEAPELALTGERTLPGIPHERYWFARHEVAYQALAGRWSLRGASVLDAGCGEGYGAQLLLEAGAQTVLALDLDAATTAHAGRRYPGLLVARANLVALPLPDRSVDAVVSLQTVEHLWDQPAFAAECARVLRPDGWLAVSTPNRVTFSPGVARGGRPLNPFHSRELDAGELVALFAGALDDVDALGVRHGPRLAAWEEQHGPVVAAQLGGPPESWAPDLAALVASVEAADFVLGPAGDDALDLVLLGRRRPA